MSIYYVYAYLRSKNSTTAPAGTPYYIGKGSNGRAYTNHGSIHLPSDKSNIIFLEKNLSENKAFEIEKFLIAYHGRIDNGTGILLNRTNGGEGCSGAIRSQETKRKMSEAKSGKKYWLGKQHTEKTKQKISETHRGEKNPLYGKYGKDNPHYGMKRSEETKAKQSAAKQAMLIVECPHCRKQGRGSNMTRYHFHNCKFKITHTPV